MENVITGLYIGVMDDDRPHQFFVNMGSAAVIFEDLPNLNGSVRINHYGDELGFRELGATPYALAAVVLNDLNEAFKMLVKYSM